MCSTLLLVGLVLVLNVCCCVRSIEIFSAFVSYLHPTSEDRGDETKKSWTSNDPPRATSRVIDGSRSCYSIIVGTRLITSLTSLVPEWNSFQCHIAPTVTHHPNHFCTVCHFFTGIDNLRQPRRYLHHR